MCMSLIKKVKSLKLPKQNNTYKTVMEELTFYGYAVTDTFDAFRVCKGGAII